MIKAYLKHNLVNMRDNANPITVLGGGSTVIHK
jgi:hypothetical protein